MITNDFIVVSFVGEYFDVASAFTVRDILIQCPFEWLETCVPGVDIFGAIAFFGLLFG